ncbi:PAS domain-containing sensor histidine kinase [Gloeocapsopsis crepidinum]|nr:PAS domain-containing sensor histidine kinase [Gloeocapsopsis crepidinum]
MIKAITMWKKIIIKIKSLLNHKQNAIACNKQSNRNQQINQTLEQKFQKQTLQLQQVNQQLADKIVEQQQIEIALRESEERYRDLFENANDLIQCVTPEGKFICVNQAWKATLEYSDTEIETLSIFEVIHPDCLDHCMEIFKKIMVSGVCNEVEAAFISKSGRKVILSGSINCKFVQGKPVSTRGIFRDITERKQAEVEIHYALAKERELVELKSRFITTASHEFRTPLAVILMAAKLLEKFSNQISEEKKQLYLERIQTAGNHMTQLLDDILIVGKLEAEKLQFAPAYLDLIQFCGEIVEHMQISSTTNLHAIKFNCTSSVTRVYLDAKLLRHILINLLSNAIKYSPQGGNINFELAYKSQEITFRIQDQGIGIPEKDQKYLFDSFYRGSNTSTIPGTGLGMSIVKQCVDLHNGNIVVESQVGVGTTVTVTIPEQC